VTLVFKNADRVKTLAYLKQKVKVNDKHIAVDSHFLFDRLLAVVERLSNVEGDFGYELTSTLTALFKDGSLRKAAKSMLAKELAKEFDTCGETYN
jgi:hypothetical protein